MKRSPQQANSNNPTPSSRFASQRKQQKNENRRSPTCAASDHESTTKSLPVCRAEKRNCGFQLPFFTRLKASRRKADNFPLFPRRFLKMSARLERKSVLTRRCDRGLSRPILGHFWPGQNDVMWRYGTVSLLFQLVRDEKASSFSRKCTTRATKCNKFVRNHVQSMTSAYSL